MQLLFVLEPWKNDKAEVLANSNEAHKLDQQQLASGTVFGWGVYSHGSSRLPVAPIDSQQLLRLQTHAVRSLPMTPTDFHLLPPRELTPQPYSPYSSDAGPALRPTTFLKGLRHDLDSLLADPKGRDTYSTKVGRRDGEVLVGAAEDEPPRVARSKIEAMVLNAEDAHRDRLGSALWFN